MDRYQIVIVVYVLHLYEIEIDLYDKEFCHEICKRTNERINQITNKNNHWNYNYFDSDIIHNGGNLMFNGINQGASSTLPYDSNLGMDVDQMMFDATTSTHP